MFTLRLWSFILSSLCVFPTDSDPDCSTDSQGGPSGLPQAVAGAHSHPPGVGEGPGWPAAAQGPTHLLPRHQDAGVQAASTGQTLVPRRK